MNQRKAILYGLRVRETPEEVNEKEIRKEFRSLMPEIFGGESTGEPLTTTFWQSCSSLLSAPRFEQVKTIKQWFLPIYKKFLSRSFCFQLSRIVLTSKSSQRDNVLEPDTSVLRTFTLSVIIMARVRSYGSILDVSLCM